MIKTGKRTCWIRQKYVRVRDRHSTDAAFVNSRHNYFYNLFLIQLSIWKTLRFTEKPQKCPITHRLYRNRNQTQTRKQQTDETYFKITSLWYKPTVNELLRIFSETKKEIPVCFQLIYCFNCFMNLKIDRHEKRFKNIILIRVVQWEQDILFLAVCRYQDYFTRWSVWS